MTPSIRPRMLTKMLMMSAVYLPMQAPRRKTTSDSATYTAVCSTVAVVAATTAPTAWQHHVVRMCIGALLRMTYTSASAAITTSFVLTNGTTF